MRDSQQQSVKCDEAWRRGFSQRTDFSGPLKQLQQSDLAEVAVGSAHGKPSLIKQIKGLVHAHPWIAELALLSHRPAPVPHPGADEASRCGKFHLDRKSTRLNSSHA